MLSYNTVILLVTLSLDCQLALSIPFTVCVYSKSREFDSLIIERNGPSKCEAYQSPQKKKSSYARDLLGYSNSMTRYESSVAAGQRLFQGENPVQIANLRVQASKSANLVIFYDLTISVAKCGMPKPKIGRPFVDECTSEKKCVIRFFLASYAYCYAQFAVLYNSKCL